MQLIAPDILAEARGLTGAMTGTVGVLGFALWLFGWRWHRFWIVAGITLASGLIGLNAGRTTAGTQVMAVGILLAVSAGLLALELAKVLAFVAGGCGAWLAVQWVLPQAQDLWAVFLSGGLFGLLLYRLWTMLLTSLLGALLAGHALTLLAEQVWHFDAVRWTAANVAALNGVVVGLVVLGILLQAVSAPDEEAKADPKAEGEGEGDAGEDDAEDEDEEPEPKPKGKAKPKPKAEKAPWWKKLLLIRRAA